MKQEELEIKAEQGSEGESTCGIVFKKHPEVKRNTKLRKSLVRDLRTLFVQVENRKGGAK